MNIKKLTHYSSLGGLLVFCYIFISSIREVFLAVYLREINIFVLLVCVFLFTAILFAILNLFRIKQIVKKSIAHLKDVIYLNSTTAIAWFSFLFSLKCIEPAFASTVVTAIGPISTFYITWKFLKEKAPTKLEVLLSLCLMLSIVSLGFITVKGNVFQSDLLLKSLMGLMLAAICGFASAANTVVTKRLMMAKFNSSELMVVRFFLLIIGSVIYLNVNQIPFTVPMNGIKTAFAISMIGISFPLFILQKGISLTDVRSASFIIAAGPIITFTFQSFYGGFEFSLLKLFAILLVMVFVFLGLLVQKKR